MDSIDGNERFRIIKWLDQRFNMKMRLDWDEWLKIDWEIGWMRLEMMTMIFGIDLEGEYK